MSMVSCAGRGWNNQVASLAPFFDFYVSAEEPEVRLPKPDAAPFEVALRRAEALAPALTLGQWVHVGDCEENDVAAAHRFGLRTVLYQPPDGE